MKTTNNNYDRFEQTILGDQVGIVSTWLDDENKDHACVMKYVMERKMELTPLAVQPHPEWRRYMEKEHYKLDNVDVVFMSGQPDGLCFRKSDMKVLLEKAMQMKTTEIK